MRCDRRRLAALAFTLAAGALPGILPAQPPGAEATVRLLRRYIEIDTSNPPGNEAEAARFLAAELDRAGIAHRTLTSPGGRASLYARLPATETSAEDTAGTAAGALVLGHHIDVVPAGDGWREPPFSGRTTGGIVWGRGAIDTKSLGIAHLVALLRLAAEETPRRRDLVFLAVADEETGGGEGTRWLLEAHPELFADALGVLGEGGVNRVIGERVAWWGVEVDQKRPLWLQLTARGRGGHGATPLLETAAHDLIAALARLLPAEPSLRAGTSVRAFLAALAAAEGGDPAARLAALDRAVAAGDLSGLPPAWLAVLYDSLQITRLEASPSINIIAREARAWLDVRLLPDSDQDAYLAGLREALGRSIEVEVLLDAPPADPSPTDHPLYRALEAILAVRAPVVPAVIPGITDSRYFRQRGIPAYGWNPFVLAGGSHGVHGKDEGIPEDAFLRGVELVVRVVRSVVER